MYIHILGQCYLVYECACVQLNEVRYRADRRRRLQKMTSYTEEEEEEDAYNLLTRINEFNGQSLIIIDMPATFKSNIIIM